MLLVLLACDLSGLDGTWWVESSSSSADAESCAERVTDHNFVGASAREEEPDAQQWANEQRSGVLASIEVEGDSALLDWRGTLYLGQLDDKGARFEGAWEDAYTATSQESDWAYAQEYEYRYDTRLRLAFADDAWTADYEMNRVYISRYTETDTWSGVMSDGYIPSSSYLERGGSSVENTATGAECAGDCFLETTYECTSTETLSATRADEAATVAR